MLDRIINGISYQQPESLIPLVANLEDQRKKTIKTLDRLLEIIAIDRERTAQGKKTHINATAEMTALQKSLKEIANIFLKITEASEEQGLTDLTDPIITKGFVKEFKGWMGIQIISHPERSQNLPTNKWKNIFIQTREKIANLADVAIQLKNLEIKHEDRGEHHTPHTVVDHLLISVKRHTKAVLPQGPTTRADTRTKKSQKPRHSSPPIFSDIHQTPPDIRFPGNIPPRPPIDLR